MLNDTLACVQQLRLEGDLNTTLRLLTELLDDQPNFLRGWIELGKTLRMMGDRPQALSTFQSALALNPQHVVTNICLAQEYQHAKNFGAAIEHYKVALKHKPDHKGALQKLMDCVEELEDDQTQQEKLYEVYHFLDALIASAEVFNEQVERQISVLLWLGDRYRKQNKPVDALECNKRVLAIRPDHLKATLNVANYWQKEGDFDRAEHVLQSILPHLSEPTEQLQVLIKLGNLAREQQQWAQALDHFQTAHQTMPERLEPQFRIIETLRELGEAEVAFQKLQDLHQTRPDNARVLLQLGLMHRYQGQQEIALENFQAARKLAFKRSGKSLTTLQMDCQWSVIEAMRTLGLLEDAKREILNSPPEFQTHLRTQLLLGSILQRHWEWSESKQFYQSLADSYPSHVAPRYELAQVFSQSGDPETAIQILRQTHESLGASLRVLLELGRLYQLIDQFDNARQVYQMANETFPRSPQVACALAEALFKHGQYEQATSILRTAQNRLPYDASIPMKWASLMQRKGDIHQCYRLLKDTKQTFSHDVTVVLQVVRLHIRCGNFEDAITTLNTINTNEHHWSKRVAQLRGEIAIQQYDLEAAEDQYRKAIALHPPTPQERNQLARALLLKGHIEEAHQQLELATEEVTQKRPLGKIGLPVKNHVATVINEFRMNPPMVAQLQAAQEEDGRDRLLALGSLLVQEPTFLGTAIYLTKELRVQGIFDQLQQALPGTHSSQGSIPKRIVQFWDDPHPPTDIDTLGQTWVEHNPDYEYKRFSLGEAIAFLQQHYDDDVLQAFRLCSHAATQSDFFRLAYLNKMGGFYADADDRCLNSLDPLRSSQADLVLFQEDFACLGNNFLGCVPGQPIIRAALYQALNNLLSYSAEWAWSQTGPGLLTSVLCSGLLPYLGSSDYRKWPRLWVMTRGELTSFVWIHVHLAYKGTEKSWQSHAYPKN